MDTDTVAVTEQEAAPIEPVINEAIEEQQEAPQVEEKETHVPLSALQKERRKRQEAEQELIALREKALRETPPQEDDSQYDTVTKADLVRKESEIVRSVEERNWIKQNPEKAEMINEKLGEFLKQRPNLAAAIKEAPNRYEEAWELMDKLTPKQKKTLYEAVKAKAVAPGSPASIPKAAALNQAVDVMSMTDAEFATWRQSKRKR